MITSRGEGKSTQLMRMGRQLGKPWLTFLSLYIEGMNLPRRVKYLTPELLCAAGWRF